MEVQIKKKKSSTKKTVITRKGKVVPIDKAIYITALKGYYEIGNVSEENSGEVYLINGNYMLQKDLNWAYDMKQYTDIPVVEAIVEYENGELIRKKVSSENPNLKTMAFEGKRHYVLMSESLKNKLHYNFATGQRYIGKPFSLQDLARQWGGKIAYPNFRTEHSYSFRDIDRERLESLQKSFAQFSKKLSPHRYDKYFQTSMGMEYETSMGNPEEERLLELGLIPLRDGSISGHEFVSFPIYEKHTNLLKEQCQLLNSQTLADNNCSLHLHLQMQKDQRTPEFVVALYELYRKLQDEIETLCPPYKRHISYLANKIVNGGQQRGAKDHCQRLPDLQLSSNNKSLVEKFRDITLLFLDEACNPNSNLVYKYRLADRPKWDHHGRYYVINMIPFFTSLTGTIEFRFFNATTNFKKVYFWALLQNLIVSFVKPENYELIFSNKQKIKLADIVAQIEERELRTFMLSMIALRKEQHQNCVLTRDIVGREFENDHVNINIPFNI